MMVNQLWPIVSDTAHSLFMFSPQARNGFYVFKRFKKNPKKNNSFATHENFMTFVFVFINKVFLEHSHFCLFMYGCFGATMAKLNSCHRDYVACKSENIY